MMRAVMIAFLCVACAACGAEATGSGSSEDDIGRGGRPSADTGGADRTDAGTSGADAGAAADAQAGADTNTSADTGAASDGGASDDAGGVDTGSTEDAGGGGGASDTGGALDALPGPDAGEPCISQVFEPGSIVRPVDIIWSIDASPSMGDEIDRIEAQMNSFASRIGASGLDYRVVVIGSDREQYLPAEAHEFFEICIPPPLSAAPGCPDTDSDRYLHVREPIHSREAIREALDTLPQYVDFLRDSSVKHFVFVTDDDERRASAADEFLALTGPGAPLGERVEVHSVVDFIGYDPGCVFDDALCSCGDERGEVYLGLTDATGGISASICQDDWSPIFEALEERVSDAVEVPCEFVVPNPGERYEVDYTAVEVETTDGAMLGRVDNAGACTAEGGWHFDNNADPTRLLLCPASCGSSAPGIAVELECYREKV